MKATLTLAILAVLIVTYVSSSLQATGPNDEGADDMADSLATVDEDRANAANKDDDDTDEFTQLLTDTSYHPVDDADTDADTDDFPYSLTNAATHSEDDAELDDFTDPEDDEDAYTVTDAALDEDTDDSTTHVPDDGTQPEGDDGGFTLTDAVADQGTDRDPDHNETEREAESETESETELDNEPETESEAEPGTEPEPEPGTEPDTTPDQDRSNTPFFRPDPDAGMVEFGFQNVIGPTVQVFVDSIRERGANGRSVGRTGKQGQSHVIPRLAQHDFTVSSLEHITYPSSNATGMNLRLVATRVLGQAAVTIDIAYITEGGRVDSAGFNADVHPGQALVTVQIQDWPFCTRGAARDSLSNCGRSVQGETLEIGVGVRVVGGSGVGGVFRRDGTARIALGKRATLIAPVVVQVDSDVETVNPTLHLFSRRVQLALTVPRFEDHVMYSTIIDLGITPTPTTSGPEVVVEEATPQEIPRLGRDKVMGLAVGLEGISAAEFSDQTIQDALIFAIATGVGATPRQIRVVSFWNRVAKSHDGVWVVLALYLKAGGHITVETVESILEDSSQLVLDLNAQLKDVGSDIAISGATVSQADIQGEPKSSHGGADNVMGATVAGAVIGTMCSIALVAAGAYILSRRRRRLRVELLPMRSDLPMSKVII